MVFEDDFKQGDIVASTTRLFDLRVIHVHLVARVAYSWSHISPGVPQSPRIVGRTNLYIPINTSYSGSSMQVDKSRRGHTASHSQ